MSTASSTPSEHVKAPTPVVTVFLLRQTPAGDEMLLVRRSGRVRTYQGVWAGVSGYLETGVTPIDQAYTELREETGLDANAVRFVQAGAPVPVEDAAQQLSWVVYPFLFTLEGGQEVRIDWEAEEMRWVSPADLASYTTVPMLREALAQVYPQPTPAAEQPGQTNTDTHDSPHT